MSTPTMIRPVLILLCWSIIFITGTHFVVHAAPPSWSVTPGPDMNTARMGHWSEVMSDGRLVIFGGHGTDFTSLNSSEIWSPSTNAFSLWAMRHPHDSGAFARLQDGRYLIAGGAADLGVAPGYNAAEIYNPADNTFTSTGTMSRARMNSSAARLSNGNVLIVGGWYDYSSAAYGELFNPLTNTFGSSGSLNTPRSLPMVLSTNDAKAVVFGGIGYFGSPMLEQVELYDSASNSFSVLQTTLFNGESGWYVSASSYTQPQQLADGKYLLLAFRSNGGAYEYTLFTFDPANKAFARQLTSPQLPDSMTASLWPPIVDQATHKAYLLGQVTGGATVQIRPYVVDLDNWTMSTPSASYTLPAAYFPDHMSAALLQDGRLFMTGGHSQAGSDTNFSPIRKTLLGAIILAGSSASGTTGTDGNDTLTGTSADDIITTGLGSDTVDGGGGIDTVRLPLFPNAYQFALTGTNQYTATYLDYTTVINNVQYVEFGSVSTTRLPIASMLSGNIQTQLARLTDLYLAFFGRAPDVSGLEYWQQQLLEKGRSFAHISMDFSWSNEAKTLFPLGASNREFVRTVYRNCFDREPDAGGWEYWTNKLDRLNPLDPNYLNDRGAFVGELILGAYAPTSGEEDRTLLTNRHNVAMYYVNRLSVQPGEGFDGAINDLLVLTTGDAATQTKAVHVIDYVFENPVTLAEVMGNQALLDELWGHEPPAGVDADGDGYTAGQQDCDDTDGSIHPGADETCGNGVDEDCSGADLTCPVDPDDVDDDSDGATENQGDCNDASSAIRPGATEICGDGIDQDCSGTDLACGPGGETQVVITGLAQAISTGNQEQVLNLLEATIRQGLSSLDLASPAVQQLATAIAQARVIRSSASLVVYETTLDAETFQFYILKEQGAWKLAGF